MLFIILLHVDLSKFIILQAFTHTTFAALITFKPAEIHPRHNYYYYINPETNNDAVDSRYTDRNNDDLLATNINENDFDSNQSSGYNSDNDSFVFNDDTVNNFNSESDSIDYHDTSIFSSLSYVSNDDYNDNDDNDDNFIDQDQDHRVMRTNQVGNSLSPPPTSTIRAQMPLKRILLSDLSSFMPIYENIHLIT